MIDGMPLGEVARTQRELKNDLAALQELGLIHLTGRARWARWILV